MQASDIPSKFPIPWGDSAGAGYIRPIPTASQIGIQNGAASLTDGFPPLNFLPTASGGVPPFGQDANGVLKQITQWSLWQSAGGPIFWDSVFSAAIGGYPRGAVVQSNTTAGMAWLSIADNNTTNPDTGGAGWVTWPTNIFANMQVFTSSGTFTVPADVSRVKVLVIGAGGGGGGSANNPGTYGSAGGGAGGTALGLYTVTPNSAVSVTIGAGGDGGFITGDGGNGGASSFGSLCSATGGNGGLYFTGAQAIARGGTGSGGAINYNGGAGALPINVTSTNTYGADGGAAALGGAGGRGALGISEPGHAPGGGGSSGGGTSGAFGSAGANGVVIAWW